MSVIQLKNITVIYGNPPGTGKEGFLNLRKHYPARRECSAGFLRLAAPVSEGITEQLSGLGFQFNFVR